MYTFSLFFILVIALVDVFGIAMPSALRSENLASRERVNVTIGNTLISTLTASTDDLDIITRKCVASPTGGKKS